MKNVTVLYRRELALLGEELGARLSNLGQVNEALFNWKAKQQMKWHRDKMASGKNGQFKIDEIESCLNGKLTKWQID